MGQLHHVVYSSPWSSPVAPTAGPRTRREQQEAPTYPTHVQHAATTSGHCCDCGVCSHLAVSFVGRWLHVYMSELNETSERERKKKRGGGYTSLHAFPPCSFLTRKSSPPILVPAGSLPVPPTTFHLNAWSCEPTPICDDFQSLNLQTASLKLSPFPLLGLRRTGKTTCPILEAKGREDLLEAQCRTPSGDLVDKCCLQLGKHCLENVTCKYFIAKWFSCSLN